MKKPDVPDNEASRLKTLRSLDILDTPSEERFDRLTRMAKRMFNVPIALVSLVDEDRQWFKSCVGLSATETPRDISFCGHAILGHEIFIIPDAAKDERFADNPLVTGDPKIRFYAGCPLSFTDGSRLGTLCIIDQKPRELTPDDLADLKDLALTAELELAAVQLATRDELTSILNRRGFMLIGQHSLNVCTRQSIPVSLAFLDLDSFKPINDNFGHAAGDHVLRVIAEQMSKVCRTSDLYGRLGGDEFVALFINASKEDAENIMKRLQQTVNDVLLQENSGYDASFSYGVVSFDPKIHTSIEMLVSEADALMYASKKVKQ
jgi:diguanylate cyclase (GGDEF)-like protein